MATDPLIALSPLDGRYAAKAAPLGPIFSESGLMRRRVLIELTPSPSRSAMPSPVPQSSDEATPAGGGTWAPWVRNH